MNCFYGNLQYQLDAKSRMRMPAKFRSDMGNEYLVTKGTGGCLFVLDKKTLEIINERISQVPISDIEGGNAIRRFTASAEIVTCDEQGRFVLPAELKKYAKIEKNVRIVGAGNKVEVWSEEVWNQLNSDDSPEAFEKVFSGLSKFGV